MSASSVVVNRLLGAPSCATIASWRRRECVDNNKQAARTGTGARALLAFRARGSGSCSSPKNLRRFRRHSGAVKPGRSNPEQNQLTPEPTYAQTPSYARVGIPWDPAELRRFVLERCSPLMLVPEPSGRPAPLPSAMEELRRHRDFARQAVTRGIAVIESWLENPDSPTEQILSHPIAVNTKHKEMKVLDKRVYEIIDLDELEPDFFTSFEYHENVYLIRAHVSFARPSAVPYQVAAQSTGAPSPDFAIPRHGKTAALPGDRRATVEADNVANVTAVCKPRVWDLHGHTARRTLIARNSWRSSRQNLWRDYWVHQ